MSENILEIKNLSMHFNIPKSEQEKTKFEKIFGGSKTLKAVDDVSLEIKKGETFGLVGESGSGKSTLGRTVIRLYDPTSGEIIFDNKPIQVLNKVEKKELASNMQMIFQDPFASVNPRLTVEEIISEGIKLHEPQKSKAQRREKVIELLKAVGLGEYHLTRYPHEFSGGQLQRVGIARSLAVKPKFIIADEAISALDVSIQAQVVNLMKDLQKKFDITYLFIAHDLSMVKYISDTIGVMYKGKLLEVASADEIYNNPLHPYTKSLLSAIPQTDPIYEKSRQRIIYNPEVEHDYVEGNKLKTPVYHNVTDTHKVYCTTEELEKWEN